MTKIEIAALVICLASAVVMTVIAIVMDANERRYVPPDLPEFKPAPPPYQPRHRWPDGETTRLRRPGD